MSVALRMLFIAHVNIFCLVWFRGCYYAEEGSRFTARFYWGFHVLQLTFLYPDLADGLMVDEAL